MPDFSALKKLLDDYVDQRKLPCYSIVISRDGNESGYLEYGFIDHEHGKSIRRDSIFRIYSMTKPMTSVALMQLWERGRLELEDPVHKYIPAFKELSVYDGGTVDHMRLIRADRPILVRDLLTHTAGLSYGFDPTHPVDELYLKEGMLSGRRENSLEVLIEKLGQLPLRFTPGTRWNYSLATDVVGYLVQQLSGLGLDEYISRHITTPLGMTDTTFQVDSNDRERFAACYQHAPEKDSYVIQDAVEGSRYLEAPILVSGGGGMVGTIDDYHIFCQTMLNKGEREGVRILKPETVELMTANQLPEGKDLGEMGQSKFGETTMEGVGFGFGYAVVLDPVRAGVLASAGEFSWGGMANTYHFVDPKTQTIVVFMSQLIPSSAYAVRTELKNAVYEALNGARTG